MVRPFLVALLSASTCSCNVCMFAPIFPTAAGFYTQPTCYKLLAPISPCYTPTSCPPVPPLLLPASLPESCGSAAGSLGWYATTTGNQLSSRLLSARSANALLELPCAEWVIEAGGSVGGLGTAGIAPECFGGHTWQQYSCQEACRP